MLKLLLKVDEYIAKAEKALVILLFALLVLLLTFNILSRNLFTVSFQKILELAPSFVVWISFLGASLALRENRHIRFDGLVRFCPEKIQKYATKFTSLFGVAVMGVLVYACYDFVNNEYEMFGAWGLSSIIFPLFFLLVGFRYLILFFRPEP